MMNKLDDTGGAKEIGHRINKAQEIRHDSDCDDFYIVSKEETKEQVETASQFIKELFRNNLGILRWIFF